MPFEVQADGPYFNILDFFGRLSRLSRIINVGDLDFTDPETNKASRYPLKPGTTVVGVFTATTYFTKACGSGVGNGRRRNRLVNPERNERIMRPANDHYRWVPLAAIAPGLSAQTKPAATPQQKPATAAGEASGCGSGSAKAGGAEHSQASCRRRRKRMLQTQTAKPAPKQAAKPAAKTPAAKPPAGETGQESGNAHCFGQEASGRHGTGQIARRDPFESLVSRQQSAANAAKNLPPEKRDCKFPLFAWTAL